LTFFAAKAAISPGSQLLKDAISHTRPIQRRSTIAGQPLQRPACALGGANPFVVATEKNDPTLSELARLGIATPVPPKNVKMGKKMMEL
jgi:hypothetical protein